MLKCQIIFVSMFLPQEKLYHTEPKWSRNYITLISKDKYG
nr:MAG TPA: hypothetical protein [Caudoviricetes sp.]